MKALTRLATRVGVIAAVVTVGSLVAVQYESITVRYLALKHQVDDANAQVATLKKHIEKGNAEVRRLSDPRGAIPEIHDRLKLFGPNEEQIYLRGVPSPAPGAWETTR